MNRLRKSVRCFAAACGLLGAFAFEAHAQQAPGTRQDFELTDRNHNNAIDREEYQRRMVEVFYIADRNKDGLVTIEELQAIETVDPADFKAADTNGDGKLTMEEFITFRMRDFTAADRNGDGALSVEEVETYSAHPR